MTWTLTELQAEIDEKSLDLKSFTEAREIIRHRVWEVSESGCKLTPLPNWSGTDAVLGSLDLAIHAIERTLEELMALKNKAPEEPKLHLVLPEDWNHEHES